MFISWQIYALPTPFTIAASSLVVIASYRTFTSARSGTVLRREGNRWRIAARDGQTVLRSELDYTLARGGYRSGWLLVLVFLDHAGHRRSIDVWRDSVDADNYSRLAFALALDHANEAASSPPDLTISSLRYTRNSPGERASRRE